MSGLTGQLNVGLNLKLVGGADLGQNDLEVAERHVKNLLNGTTAGKVDLAFADKRTISGSSTDTLDLAGGLNDAFGVALTFAKIRAIYIQAAAANGDNLVCGGASSNAFVGPFSDATDEIVVSPGGVFLIADFEAGWTVTASTGDLLDIENLDASDAIYDIILLGTSA